MSLFALISTVIALAAVASYVNFRFIRLPHTIGVMLVALVASLALNLAGSFAGTLRDHAATIVGQIDFDEVVLHGMLAFLLFAGAIHVNLADLGRQWLPVGLLAIVGTLLSTVIVGCLTWLVMAALGIPLSLMHAMLFGALISPTDPIAVLGIMKSVGAPKDLEIQMSGESLFNDGVGVVIFTVMLELSGMNAASHGPQVNVQNVSLLLLREVGGAIALGIFAGSLAYHMLRRIDDYQVEVLITLALAMGGYALADGLHLSAPIAIVVAGVLIGNEGRAYAMSQSTEEHIDTFWELVDGILNAVLFLLIGMEMLVVPLRGLWLVAGALIVPVVLLARWASVLGILWPLNKIREQPTGAVAVLTWGGLRGGISVAMALSLPEDPSRALLLTLTYCVVVFSILVQGLTIGPVIRRATRCSPVQPLNLPPMT